MITFTSQASGRQSSSFWKYSSLSMVSNPGIRFWMMIGWGLSLAPFFDLSFSGITKFDGTSTVYSLPTPLPSCCSPNVSRSRDILASSINEVGPSSTILISSLLPYYSFLWFPWLHSSHSSDSLSPSSPVQFVLSLLESTRAFSEESRVPFPSLPRQSMFHEQRKCEYLIVNHLCEIHFLFLRVTLLYSKDIGRLH